MPTFCLVTIKVFATALHNETKDPNESQVASLSWPLIVLLLLYPSLSSSISLCVLNAKAAGANEITKCPSAAVEQNKLRHQMSDNQNVAGKDKEREGRGAGAGKRGCRRRGRQVGSGCSLICHSNIRRLRVALCCLRL